QGIESAGVGRASGRLARTDGRLRFRRRRVLCASGRGLFSGNLAPLVRGTGAGTLAPLPFWVMGHDGSRATGAHIPMIVLWLDPVGVWLGPLGHRRFGWLYLTGFVEPAPARKRKKLFELILADLAKSSGPGHGPETSLFPMAFA